MKLSAVSEGASSVEIATVLKFAKLIFIVFAEIRELIYIFTELMLVAVIFVVRMLTVLIVEAVIVNTFTFLVTMLVAVKELA